MGEQGIYPARISTLTGHENHVTGVAFSGSMLASGSTDKTLKVWDCQSGKHTTYPQGNPVTAVAPSPTGIGVAIGNEVNVLESQVTAAAQPDEFAASSGLALLFQQHGIANELL